MTRDQKLNAIYRATHKDYKGKVDGVRTIMIYREGTCLVRLDDLTDQEIERLLPKQSS